MFERFHVTVEVGHYGSIPHKLIKTAMSHYHIPAHVVNIINNYIGDIKIRFTYNDITKKVARPGERNCIMMYHLTNHVRGVNEPDHQSSRKGN